MAAPNADRGASAPNHSLTGAQAADSTAIPIHKRTYQACIPCRRRKVRCDLGPVDDPHEPPCVRCRRESKECYFSATRRKRKADGEGSELGDGDQAVDDYAARNGRKAARRHGSMEESSPGLQHHQRSLPSGSFSTTSPLDGYDLPDGERYQQPGPYTTSGVLNKSEVGQDQEVTNETAAALFQSPINIPGDALHLLLKASGQSEDLQRRDTASQGRGSTARSAQRPAPMQGNYHTAKPDSFNAQPGQQYSSHIDPAIAGDRPEHGKTPVPKETLEVWSRLRFVRAGWFTAREGILYIDYFYQFISPLTPISLPKIRSHTDHPGLLKDEPMLTISMLTIASRYLKLPGPGGQTRSFMIHERLWNYLQSMITCMFWGQEQFGGGFCGAGTRRLGQTNAIKGGLRTLGTIESLLLLNEFHPRSMHFPPRDDDDEILAPADNDPNNGPTHGFSNDESVLGGDPTIADWTEPALRSDRICWSLIGTSYVLAYELGIFGTYSDGVQSADGRVRRDGGSPEYCRRADRIERLLYVFVVQAAGRFGLPTMYSDDINRFTLASFHNGSLPGVAYVKESSDVTENLAVGSSLPPEAVDKTQLLWVELMVIMKTCNDQLFTTKDQTATLIHSGGYVQCLQELQPLLHSWYRRFETLEVPKHARCIIAIEYHYISLYINSLALQAVLEQWTTKVNAMPQSEGPASPASSISSSFTSLYSRNEQYIKEVIDSSRIVLRHVVEGLLPDDQLKHAPTFALGGKQVEVAISLRLLDDTVRALRTSVVDDVHLCLRISDLLERLTTSVRSQFVRLPPRSFPSPEHARRTAQQQQYDNINNNASAFAPQDRFSYRTDTGDVFQNPLAGISRTYNNPHDSNISIMPPIGNTYANNNNATYNLPYSPNQQQASPQQQLQQYPMSNDFTMPSEEDWLTLDLNPLLDTSGMNGGDNQWFGAFGPETHNNLEVLGKLVNDQYRGDGYGDGGMGF